MVDILPVLVGILGILAFLYFSGLTGRLVLLICPILWLIYNFVGGSIAGIITEIFMIAAGLITIFKLISKKYEV